MKHRVAHTDWPVLAAIALVAACGQARDVGDDGAERAEGLALVAGAALERHAILLVPRGGGIAQLRSMAQPAESLSNGSTVLPASVEARSLQRFVVLREADGTVHRYDPRHDVLTTQGTVSREARWSDDGTRGVYFEPESGGILLISEAGAYTFEAGHALRWAAPLGPESVLVLTTGPEGSSLTALRPDDLEMPEVELAAAVPGLIVAWGRQGVFSTEAGLQLVDLPSLELEEIISLPDFATALVASPSSHRVYVAVGGDGRLVALNRYSGEQSAVAKVNARVHELRSSLFGAFLLLRTDEASWFVSVVDGETAMVGSSWRPDLPLGLPGGRVLVLEADSVRLWNAVDGARTPAAGSSAAWWLPVDYRITRDRATLARRAAATDSTTVASEDTRSGEEGAEETDSALARGAAGELAEGASTATSEATANGVPPGFYAVVASSLSPGGIRDLAESLALAGYETHVQLYRDEANEIWYRAVVGPHTTRDEAEETGRRLRAERGLQAWVQEVEAAALRSGE